MVVLSSSVGSRLTRIPALPLSILHHQPNIRVIAKKSLSLFPQQPTIRLDPKGIGLIKNSPSAGCRLFSSAQKTANSTYRILSIDGGGIRGIIPGMVLEYMEKYTRKDVHQLFDGIAGTSTGGILGLCASAPLKAGSKDKRFSASEMLSIYTTPDVSQEIFLSPPAVEPLAGRGILIIRILFGSGTLEIERGRPGDPKQLPRVLSKLWETRYVEHGLEGILQDKFEALELKDMLTDVLITSVDIKTRIPKFFTRAQAIKDPKENQLIWKIARITSAAPTIFNPVPLDELLLVDGGIVANNPALCMILDAKQRNIPLDNMMCVSLGTGEHRPILDTRDIGLVEFGLKVFGVMSLASSALVDQQSQQLLQNRYHRFQAFLDEDIPLDGIGKANIEKLQRIGKELIQKNERKIREVCDQLKEIGEKKPAKTK